MQGRPREARDFCLQGTKAVVQWQKRVLAECDDDRFFVMNRTVERRAAARTLDTRMAAIARVLDKPVAKLTVCMLNRPRHEAYIRDIRRLGTRLKLIQDCDISGAIACCLPEREIDLLYGVGGAPESVVTACAMKCLKGDFQAQLWKDGEVFGPVYGCEDLVRGPCAFAATGITNGSQG